jgi:hypothetical protein
VTKIGAVRRIKELPTSRDVPKNKGALTTRPAKIGTLPVRRDSISALTPKLEDPAVAETNDLDSNFRVQPGFPARLSCA